MLKSRLLRLLTIALLLALTAGHAAAAGTVYYLDIAVLAITSRTPVPQYDLLVFRLGPYTFQSDAANAASAAGQSGAFNGLIYYPPNRVQAVTIVPYCAECIPAPASSLPSP